MCISVVVMVVVIIFRNSVFMLGWKWFVLLELIVSRFSLFSGIIVVECMLVVCGLNSCCSCLFDSWLVIGLWWVRKLVNLGRLVCFLGICSS